jgi:hypothetical protein
MDDGQLVAERDDFQVQRGARLDDTSQRVEQRNGDGRHDCRLSENGWNLNPRNTYEVLGRHSGFAGHVRKTTSKYDRALSSPSHIKRQTAHRNTESETALTNVRKFPIAKCRTHESEAEIRRSTS